MNDLDLIDFPNLTPESIEAACRAAIVACDAGIAAIVAVPHGERTFANTMLTLKEAVDGVSLVSGTYAFMAYVADDEAVREKAREMDQELDKYMVGLGFREDLYAAVRGFAETDESRALTGEDARYVERELRDYRRNGFALPVEERGRLRQIFDRLVEVGTEFRNNVDDWDDGIEVEREGLAGLPEAFIGGLKRTADGRYRVSLDYPEFFPFMSNADSAELREALFRKDQVKGGAANIALLEEAIRLRNEAALLLGYDSWAAYAVEPRMAKRRETVDAFLADVRAKLDVKAAVDMAGLGTLKREQVGDGEVHIWDWRYYHNQLMKTRYAVDEFEVAKYFPLQACLDGLFETVQSLLGVRFEQVEPPVWNADVRSYDVYDAGGTEPFARFHMDLFPRPNTYGHAAAFTMRRGRRLPDGSYQRPVSAIVANFTKPTADSPSLLRHSELVTLWHEFGHILHQTLTRTERSNFSGTATERDFVEAPSQMLEHWCWEPTVLQGFARHYETGEPIPADLVAKLIEAKSLDSGIMFLRQMFFASLDFAYHSPGFSGDTTAVAAALHPITGFPFPADTHFQSGFGHLFGYDAGYYGYLWSHVFGDDMYTRFEAAGITNPEIGRHYRSTVLERGGSVDGDQLVREFLGREPDSGAFLRGLGLE